MAKSCVVLVAISIVLSCVLSSVAHANGVVGTGTAASCTEAALDAALSGGGEVSFACGASPHAIAVSSTKQIEVPTVLRGDGLITISGNATVSVFQVFFQASLELIDITISRGSGSFGAVQNFGTLAVTNSRIELSMASATGGGIDNYGEAQLSDSVISGNQATQSGAGIYNAGTLTINGGEVSGNATSTEYGYQIGGGIHHASGTLTLNGATILGNYATHGGGIYSEAEIEVVDSVIAENHVSFQGTAKGGGAFFASSTALVSGTRFSDNIAMAGGGLFVEQAATVTVSGCDLVGNEGDLVGSEGGEHGAAVANRGQLLVTNSTIHENDNLEGFAAVQSGIPSGLVGNAAFGRLTLRNVTISGNDGGSLYIPTGIATLEFVTIAGNAGLYGIQAAPGALTIRNSILAGNSPANCYQTITADSWGFNLSSDASCGLFQTGDKENVDPLLGPLADNGGATLTHLPAAASDAIDHGSCSIDVTTDQRGIARPQGEACDIGAVERSPSDDTTTTTSTTTSTTAGATTSTTLSGGGACADPVTLVTGSVVTATAEASAGSTGSTVTASDALAVLSAAVGSIACELCVCDVDGSGGITASDALATLFAAVGLPGTLDCPPCV